MAGSLGCFSDCFPSLLKPDLLQITIACLRLYKILITVLPNLFLPAAKPSGHRTVRVVVVVVVVVGGGLL